MDESMATAFECRQLALQYEPCNFNHGKRFMDLPTPYRNAILVEALTLLADKKDAERIVTTRND